MLPARSSFLRSSAATIGPRSLCWNFISNPHASAWALRQGRIASATSASAPQGEFKMATMTSVPVVDVEKYEQHLAGKTAQVQALFKDFPALPELEVFKSPAENYRCRCEFSVWHEGDEMYYIMFETPPGETKPQRKRVDGYPVASKAINEMMPVVLAEVSKCTLLRKSLFQVSYHTSISRQAVVTLVYHKKLDAVTEEWTKRATQLRPKLLECESVDDVHIQRCSKNQSIVLEGVFRAKLLECESVDEVHVQGRSKKQSIVLDRNFVIERMNIEGREYTQKQVEGCFSQPNGVMCEQMVSWAVRATRNSPGDLLELYCGNGNFTVPMAQNFRKVIATELMKVSVAAAHDNLADNAVENVLMVRMSSEEFVEAWKTKAEKNRLKGLDWDTLELNTLLVDPPRCGLDEETEKLMASFERVVYVSCNPETLHANLQRVKETHTIERMALFDQFPFTHHIECGVYLVRKPSLSPEAVDAVKAVAMSAAAESVSAVEAVATGAPAPMPAAAAVDI